MRQLLTMSGAAAGELVLRHHGKERLQTTYTTPAYVDR